MRKLIKANFHALLYETIRSGSSLSNRVSSLRFKRSHPPRTRATQQPLFFSTKMSTTRPSRRSLRSSTSARLRTSLYSSIPIPMIRQPECGDFSSSPAFSLRWFTPEAEVPLCGHATIASAHAIYSLHNNPSPVLTFRTLSGLQTIFKFLSKQVTSSCRSLHRVYACPSQ